MNTAHSIIVNVPTEDKGFELTAFNSNLKDEIRVETSHGTHLDMVRRRKHGYLEALRENRLPIDRTLVVCPDNGMR